MNLKVTAQDVIEIILAEDGYWGKKYATDNLDIKEAPNGTGEYTKYARDLFEAGYYNGNKQGHDGHCTVFADWAFWKAQGCPKRSVLNNANCLNPVNENGAGAAFNAGCYDAWGLLDDKPRLGDKIYICAKKKDGSIGDAYHMGVVVAINGNTLTTMEGNTKNQNGDDNAYCRKVRTLDTSYMRFGHPRYYVEVVDVTALRKTIGDQATRIAKLEEENALLKLKAEKYDTIKSALDQFIKAVE